MTAHRRVGTGVLLALLAALTLASLTLVVTTLARGFDFTDEAFVYSIVDTNRSAPGEVWGFQHLLHPLWQATGASVLVFRALRLLGYIALGVALVFAARHVLSRLGVTLRPSSWVIVALVAQTGTFAAWAYPPRYLGYNELSSFFAQLASALLLVLLARSISSTQRERWRAGWAIWAGIGALMVLLAFAKITAVVLMGVVVIAVVVLARRPLRLVVRIAALVGGALLMLLILVAIGVPVAGYLTNMIGLVLDPALSDESGHSVSDLAVVYAKSVLASGRALAIPAILIGIVLLVSSRAERPDSAVGRARRVVRVVLVLLTVGAAAIVLMPTAGTVWDDLGADIVLLLVVAALALVAVGRGAFALPREGTPVTAAVIAGAAVVVLGPFAPALGTNNPLIGQILFSATLWATAAGVGLALLWERSPAIGLLRAAPAAIAVVLVANSLGWVAADVFQHPYRTDPYYSQHSSVDFQPLRGVQLTASDAALVRWLEQTAASEGAQSTPTTTITNSGALFVFNNSTWASSWMSSNSGPGLTRACLADPPERLYLLQPSTEMPGSAAYDAVIGGLDKCGIAFPDDFVEVANHPSDDPADAVTLWRFDR